MCTHKTYMYTYKYSACHVQANGTVFKLLNNFVVSAVKQMCNCLCSDTQCPILCNPMDCGPPGSSVHWDSPGKVQEWVAISFRGMLLTQGSAVSYIAQTDSLPPLRKPRGMAWEYPKSIYT